MESALSADMLATDLAYYLVRKGVSQNSLPCHFFSFLRELMPVSVLDIRTMSGGIVCIQHQRDHTAPVCSHRHQHLCTRYKSQTLAVTPLFGHTKMLHSLILHKLIGMGSTALAAAVPCPGKATTFPASVAYLTAVPYPGKATKCPARDEEIDVIINHQVC